MPPVDFLKSLPNCFLRPYHFKLVLKFFSWNFYNRVQDVISHFQCNDFFAHTRDYFFDKRPVLISNVQKWFSSVSKDLYLSNDIKKENWDFSLSVFFHYFLRFCSTPGQEKNAKICKISGEKLVFSSQISYIILRWNAVNAVKLCKFTARLSGDLTKIHHNSPLKYVISPPLQGSEPLTSCMSSTSSSTAPSLTKFYYFLFEYKSNSLYFLQNMRGEFL